MTEAEDWKRQIIALEEHNYDQYRYIQELEINNKLLRDKIANLKTSNVLLQEAQQEGVEF